jgi:hypothetical protein
MPKDDTSAAAVIILGIAAAAGLAWLAKHESEKVQTTVRCTQCGGYFAARAHPTQTRLLAFCPYCSKFTFAEKD